jgi:hypothetical protein
MGQDVNCFGPTAEQINEEMHREAGTSFALAVRRDHGCEGMHGRTCKRQVFARDASRISANEPAVGKLCPASRSDGLSLFQATT